VRVFAEGVVQAGINRQAIYAMKEEANKRSCGVDMIPIQA